MEVCSVYARPTIIAIKRSKTVRGRLARCNFRGAQLWSERSRTGCSCRSCSPFLSSRSRATRFSHCLLIPRCGNDLWDRVGSGMAEKWYFRGDTLNHGIEKQPLQTSLASFRSVFCESFFFLSFFRLLARFDDKNFTRRRDGEDTINEINFAQIHRWWKLHRQLFKFDYSSVKMIIEWFIDRAMHQKRIFFYSFQIYEMIMYVR